MFRQNDFDAKADAVDRGHEIKLVLQPPPENKLRFTHKILANILTTRILCV